MRGKITYQDRRGRRLGGNFIGVWVDGQPAGRIREAPRSDGRFRAFTNRRAPGNAFLGGFATLEEAGEAVARERGRASAQAIPLCGCTNEALEAGRSCGQPECPNRARSG